MDILTIEGFKHPVHLGCTEEERCYPQIVTFEISIALDIKPSAKSDELADTVDYRSVVAVVQKMAEECEWKLIEKMCEEISQEILASFKKISEVTLQATKYIHPQTSGISCRIVRNR